MGGLDFQASAPRGRLPSPRGYLHLVFTAIAPGHPLRKHAVPLKPRPHRQSVGLRPTDQLLLLGPDTPAQLQAKRRLLRQRRSELVGVLPGEGPAALLVAEAVAASAGRPLPKSDRGFDPEAIAAETLAEVAANVSEDICVMARRDGRWQLVALCVCFPSHWSPTAKLGGSLETIHGPVPNYPRISAATDAAFDRIAATVDSEPPLSAIWERYNWTLVADDELCHAQAGSPAPGVAAPDQLWLRVERQTLTAVAEDIVVFLIRTFLTPLADLDSRERRALGAAVAGVSDELAEYRGWVGYREVVEPWADLA